MYTRPLFVSVVLTLSLGFIHFGERRFVPLVPIFDETGKPLEKAFDGLKSNPKFAQNRQILKVPETSRCRKSADLKGITGTFSNWFDPQVVHADDCPTCSPPEVCTGQYMFPLPYGCAQGCGGGEYYHYISWPPGASAGKGYCYAGDTTCPPCNQCRETDCNQV